MPERSLVSTVMRVKPPPNVRPARLHGMIPSNRTNMTMVATAETAALTLFARFTSNSTPTR